MWCLRKGSEGHFELVVPGWIKITPYLPQEKILNTSLSLIFIQHWQWNRGFLKLIQFRTALSGALWPEPLASCTEYYDTFALICLRGRLVNTWQARTFLMCKVGLKFKLFIFLCRSGCTCVVLSGASSYHFCQFSDASARKRSFCVFSDDVFETDGRRARFQEEFLWKTVRYSGYRVIDVIIICFRFVGFATTRSGIEGISRDYSDSSL